MYEAFASHCRQVYAGEYEILFGASSMDDPAVAAIDDGRRAGHRALLGEGIAAVGGHVVVEVVFGEGHEAS